MYNLYVVMVQAQLQDHSGYLKKWGLKGCIMVSFCVQYYGEFFVMEFRPFKIDCMFCVRIFLKSYARVRKQNTQHKKINGPRRTAFDRVFMGNCCVCFLSKQIKSYAHVDAKHTINFKRPYPN